MTTERIRSLRLTDEELLGMGRKDAADAQYRKLVEGLVEWLLEDDISAYDMEQTWANAWKASRNTLGHELERVLTGEAEPSTDTEALEE